MKKKVLISLFIIAGVGAAGFAATRAFFQSRVRSTDSSFTVGTLDLSVNDKQEAVDNFVVEGIGASGNITGSKTWTVKNVGSLPGRLFFSLANVNNQENGCNRPEKADEANCEADNIGELGEVISVKVSANDTAMVESKLANTNQADYATQWNEKSEIVIPAGESIKIVMEWNANQNDYNNSIQSDSLTFDTIFDLVQLTNE